MSKWISHSLKLWLHELFFLLFFSLECTTICQLALSFKMLTFLAVAAVLWIVFRFYCLFSGALYILSVSLVVVTIRVFMKCFLTGLVSLSAVRSWWMQDMMSGSQIKKTSLCCTGQPSTTAQSWSSKTCTHHICLITAESPERQEEPVMLTCRHSSEGYSPCLNTVWSDVSDNSVSVSTSHT